MAGCPVMSWPWQDSCGELSHSTYWDQLVSRIEHKKYFNIWHHLWRQRNWQDTISVAVQGKKTVISEDLLLNVSPWHGMGGSKAPRSCSENEKWASRGLKVKYNLRDTMETCYDGFHGRSNWTHLRYYFFQRNRRSQDQYYPMSGEISRQRSSNWQEIPKEETVKAL